MVLLVNLMENDIRIYIIQMDLDKTIIYIIYIYKFE